MKHIYLIGSLLFIITFSVKSQVSEHQLLKRCGTMEHLEYLKQMDPTLENRIQNDREQFMIFKDIVNERNVNQVITIPVVVHVVYKTLGQRISMQQIQSQIDVLNEDFGRRNPDSVLTPAIFRNRAANTNIRFCLASEEPGGGVTEGVNYVETTVTSFTDNDDIKRTSSGGADPWDVTKYFNIWVGNLGGGLLGYAEFPTSSPSPTYGVVIKYNAFGRVGTLAVPYNKGRTATHEIAHCFNLSHIWGDEPGCSNDDGIADTPLQKDNNFGCPSFPQGPSKSGGCCDSSQVSSMYMNYMDYSDDACMNIFTHDQSDEMNLSLQFFNSSLLNSDVCPDFIGIHENDKKNPFVTYPNPVTEELVVMFDSQPSSDIEIIIYDCIGKAINRGVKLSSFKATIDMGSEAPGLYYLVIKDGKETYTSKFVVDR